MTNSIDDGYSKLRRAMIPTLEQGKLEGTIRSVLSEHEVELIGMRFGLTGDGPTSIDETASRLRLSPNDVRTIEALALRKLRVESGITTRN